MDISVKVLQQAISIRRQIDTLEKRLSSMLRGSPASSPPRTGRRHMSAATRAKLAAAARARWAKLKAGTKTTPPKKGGITPAGRKRLSQLMKARWAAAAQMINGAAVAGNLVRQ
ncbi:MAG: hypothetical protein DME87_10450 [Verrucomicrobia bacterium]|nr:MAG: hypothetical protein DME87_10450 [Verrucomicrobiota bacterium]